MPGVGEELVDSGCVETIRQVEHVDDQIRIDALAEINALGDTEIVENGPGLNPAVALKVAVQRQQRAVKVSGAGLLKNAGGRKLGVDDWISQGGATGIDKSVRPTGIGRKLEGYRSSR